MNTLGDLSLFYYSYKKVNTVAAMPAMKIPYMDITYCIEGEMRYTFEGTEYVLCSGDAIVFPSGSTRARIESHTPTLYASLNVRSEQALYPAIGGVVRNGLRSDTLSILKSMKKSYESVSKERDKKCAALFYYLYYQLSDTSANNENPHIKNIKKYIASHLCDKIRLSDIADAVHLAPNYCSALFSECEGQSIFEFITAHKIELSKSMIAADDMTISEIAFRVGFSDLNYFSRTFREVAGMSPTAYRRSLKDI